MRPVRWASFSRPLIVVPTLPSDDHTSPSIGSPVPIAPEIVACANLPFGRREPGGHRVAIEVEASESRSPMVTQKYELLRVSIGGR